MPAWVNAGFDDYAKRMPRDFALDLVELKPEPRDRGKTVAQLLAAEAPRIRAACSSFHLVALDERGAAWTTSQLAAHLERWRNEAINPAFVIGSADGLDPALVSTPGGLARLCRENPSVRNLYALALSSEYADTRWRAARAQPRL